MDAPVFVAKFGANAGNLLYVDPPYESVGEKYYASTVDFDDLESALRDCKARVAVSGYGSCRWDCLDWHRHEHTTTTSIARNSTNTRYERTEILWTNYDPPVDERLF